jgi:hypothetical protein
VGQEGSEDQKQAQGGREVECFLARRMYNESRQSGEGMEDNQQEKS